MQWIYGGAWIVGSNEDNNMRYISSTNKVVVVAANYRLDLFGWIALQELEDEDEHNSYGNYGLRDQGFAMEWTQRNIHLFGGDKNKVTIFGESAGGFSVCQHLVRPASNGLFSHAIMESGDCDGPWLLVEGAQAKTWGKEYAKYVGCKGKVTYERSKLFLSVRGLQVHLLRHFSQFFHGMHTNLYLPIVFLRLCRIC
jgi:carboxylesterase type B